jgi:hypothetical protein
MLCLTPRRIWHVVAGLVLLSAAGVSCAPNTPDIRAMAEAAPPPAGQARIWFYRDWSPSESLNLANIDMNGRYVGSVANGGAFYSDVPPGRYHIVPQSYNHDFSQNANVTVAPGELVYVKILSSQSWDGACRDCLRDTFYAWLVPPAGGPARVARGG